MQQLFLTLKELRKALPRIWQSLFIDLSSYWITFRDHEMITIALKGRLRKQNAGKWFGTGSDYFFQLIHRT